MTTIQDLAELEAAIAEADLTDAQAEAVKLAVADGAAVADAIALVREVAEAGASVPPEPAPEPPPSDEPTAKQWKSLAAEQERHENRVREIMGAHLAGFTTCEECGGIGLRPPGPQPRTHEWFRACDVCAGFGEVLTGSRRDGSISRDCPACAGRGYVEALAQDGSPLASQGSRPIPPPPSVPPPLPQEPASSGNGQPAAPAFGVPSWMGDPNLARP